MGNDIVDDGMVQDFFVDVDSSFSGQLSDAMELANAGEVQPAVEAMLRPLHTIKGTAGFLGMGEVSSFTHALEEYLKAVQAGTAAPDIGLMNRGVDTVFALLERSRYGEELESTGHKDLAVILHGGQTGPAEQKPSGTVNVERRNDIFVIRVRAPRVHLPRQYGPIMEALDSVPAGTRTLLDLDGVRTLNSTTWGAIRVAADKLRIAVCGLSQACRSTFYSWGFDEVMKAYESEQDFWEAQPEP